MQSKTDLRITAKSIRKTLDIATKSVKAVRSIRELTEYKLANHILIFYPLKYEIDLLGLLSDDKNFYLPKVCESDLLVCPFRKADKLEKSLLNICEPCSNPVDPEIIDFVIVPALMADEENYRLGYGGGFYDRFLAKYPNNFTVLPIVNELCIETLPHDDFDIKVDKVLKI